MFARLLLYLITLLYIALMLLIIQQTKTITDLQKTENAVPDLELQMFENYVTRFNKTYSSREYKIRLKKFKASLAEIARLNALHNDTVFGLTTFADMSAQEFEEHMLMKRGNRDCISYNSKCFKASNHLGDAPLMPMLPLPKNIDWRRKGVIGPVMDQRNCKGCWAISIAGVMEAKAKRENLLNEDLSIQQILDCMVEKDQFGCNGGNVASTLTNICWEHQNITTAQKYPLTLRNEKCQIRSNRGIMLKRFIYKCQKENISVIEAEENIQRALMNGPITAVVNAAIWRFYLGGIIRRACVRSDTSAEHVIQVVGFDRNGDIPYYIVKNSWGRLFGDHGYVKLEMDKNMCGISEEIGIIDDVLINEHI